ncbi:MAG TPA: transcription termination/antitermination factor NusG, partial [candidate division WWE3 bacterium]|nr:transcription termination/antitermination factor NusG [candidate division WWE3 bacterium]
KFDTQPTDKFKWYVVHTYSGYEQKAVASLKDRLENTGLYKQVAQIIVPTRKKIAVSEGKKKEVDEKLFPGYVLIHMDLTNELWSLIRKTDHVTGFIGTGTRPVPISKKEVEAILKIMNLSAPTFEAKFKEGDSVKIITGPFKEFLGIVQEVNEEQGKVKVLISSFGREVPLEMDMSQVTPL